METYKRVESWTIIRKDFEGFKMAQKEIVKAILEIEDQIIPLRKLKEEITRGKKRMEVSRDPNYVKHSISEERLILQKAAFQDVANSIVWILFGATRGHVRRLINPESRHGYLRDRNLDTEIAVVEMINESSDSFALLADITSVVGIGDIIELSPRGLKIMEIKAGKVAEIFFESVSEQELSMKVENFVQDDPRRMRALEKQMGRQARQIIRMKRAI
ncbi:MAG: hypothetical protein Q8Q33_05215, partial [Chlamydiota bacterium]|nr:hypothetical protein [Chlamydiota bacterium]